MTPRQFFNGLLGKYQYDEKMLEAKRDLIFSAARFQASSISAGLSQKLSRQISKYKFAWETDQQKLKVEGTQYISYDKVKSSLDMITED